MEYITIIFLSPTAPFSQKMRLISSWTVPEGTRFEGMFRFEVQSNAEPFTESFNVSFGIAVTSFKVDIINGFTQNLSSSTQKRTIMVFLSSKLYSEKQLYAKPV